MKLPRLRLKPWMKFFGPVMMLALVPTMTSFLGNRYQVSVQNLVAPVIVELLVGALVAGVFYRLWRRDQPAGYLAAVLATLILASNFDSRISGLEPLWNALTPITGLSGAVFAVAAIVAVLALTGALGRLFGRWVIRRGWRVRDVAGGFLVMIAVTFGIEFLNVAGNLAVEWPQFFYKPPKLATISDSAKAGDKPDIYYILLDRYASNDVLKQQFGFDNADFTKFLQEQGYYINPSSHNNYPYTTMSVASTMTGNYLNDIINKFGKSSAQTIVPFNESVRNSAVASTLKDAGYKYDLVGNWYETSNLSPLADEAYEGSGRLTVLGHTFTLDNFAKLSLMQSPFSRIIQLHLTIGNFGVLTYQNMGDVEMLGNQLKTLNTLADAKPGGRFIFAHLLIPHEPYYFNADGSLSNNSSSDSQGIPVKQKYLNQIEYINGQMKDVLNKINEKSGGKSVVVLQADEGPYPFQFDANFNPSALDGELQEGDMRNWSDTALKIKLGNQAAYHIPVADMAKDAGAADNVNVFRLVLNSYFGTNLPYLPDCYYAYPNGRDKPIEFTSVTDRLTGAPEDARCGANGTATP